MEISSKIKDLALKTTDTVNNREVQNLTRSEIHCVDCVLIIQRNNNHRRMVGINTGTFTEIVVDLLKHKLPVQLATLEGLSAVEQIQLFSNARIVIAVHGAALTNLIWMRPRRSAVVEVLVDHGWGVHLTSRDNQTLECMGPCTENYFEFDYFNLARLWSVHHTYVQSNFSSPLLNVEEHNSLIDQTKYISRDIFYIDSQMMARKVARLYDALIRQKDDSSDRSLHESQ